MSGDPAIFRQAALDRLASPERLDERLALPAYPRALVIAVVVLALCVAAFAAWMALAP